MSSHVLDIFGKSNGSARSTLYSETSINDAPALRRLEREISRLSA